MSASDERMREIIVQGSPDLQEIHLYYMQKLQSLEDELASFKARGAESISCSCAPMAATLWSTLPDELLEQIFARLPLPEIIRLQCLSNKWKWNLTSRDSAFKRACAEASPKMFAMVSDRRGHNYVSVELFDIKANRWHSYEQTMPFCHKHTLYAGDGGLVCVLVCMKTPRGESSSLITVFNPLDPRASRFLPHEDLRDLELEMVQLVMDRDRRCYKVLAVGAKNGRVVAKIFSSETGAWNGEIFEGLVFGHQFSCDKPVPYVNFPDDRGRPCAYDSVGHQLLELNDGSHPCEERTYVQFRNREYSSKCYALVKDHLFVLHEEPYVGTHEETGRQYCSRRYCISEYRGQKCEPHWVKLRTHRCKEFERPPTSMLYKMSLCACKSFLFVKAENKEYGEYRHVLTWLYDMATEKWQTVPPFAEKVYISSQKAMFELHWDAIP